MVSVLFILTIISCIVEVLSSPLQHTPIFNKYWNGSNTKYGLFYVPNTAGYRFGVDCDVTTDIDYYNQLIKRVQCGNNIHCNNHMFTCDSSGSSFDCYGVDHIIEYELGMRAICVDRLCGSRIYANRIMAWKEWIIQRNQLDKYSAFNEIQIVYGINFVSNVVDCIVHCDNHFVDGKKRLYVPPVAKCICCYPQSKCDVISSINMLELKLCAIIIVIVIILYILLKLLWRSCHRKQHNDLEVGRYEMVSTR